MALPTIDRVRSAEVSRRARRSVLLLLLACCSMLLLPSLAVTRTPPLGITITDLGTLGGPESQAHAINEQGQIVGWSDTAAGELHAFLWQRDTMTDLGTLGGTMAAASDINDQGQIVGGSTTATRNWHAFLWQQGSRTDLGTLGGINSEARDINEQGQVVGISSTAGGVATHAVLWTLSTTAQRYGAYLPLVMH